MNWR